MDNLYNTNGLVFWTEDEIKMRRMLEEYFVMKIRAILKSQNRAFDFFQVEAPLLTPQELINKNYTVGDVFVQDDKFTADKFMLWLRTSDHNTVMEEFTNHLPLETKLIEQFTIFKNNESPTPHDIEVWTDIFNTYSVFAKRHLVLRPETTMGSYAYARHLLNPHNVPKVYPPIVVWQHGKSFRKEQDQPTKFMRLKEFYQLEFQIIYSKTTKNDYSVALLPGVRDMLTDMIGPCRLEKSDRLPDYAEWTEDVIFEKNNMEVCSMSKRKDLDGMDVIEVAIGTDRAVHCFSLDGTDR